MEKAFWNCSNLAMANMLDHCPAIGDKAFEGCKNGFKIGHSAGAASAFSGAGYALTETAAHAVIPTVYAEAGSTAIIAVNIEANDGMLTNTDATISLGSVTKVANIGHSYNGLYDIRCRFRRHCARAAPRRSAQLLQARPSAERS